MRIGLTLWACMLLWIAEEVSCIGPRTRTSSVPLSLSRPWSTFRSNQHQQQQQQQQQQQSLHCHDFEMNIKLFVSLRGGAMDLGKALSGDENKEVGFVLTKVRNLVRSVLQSTQGTPIESLVRGLLATVEAFTGMSLLPQPESKKSTQKARKKKTTTQSSAQTPSSSSSSSTKGKAKSSHKTTTTASTKASGWEQNDIKSSSPNYRIQRELKAFLADPPPNLSVKVGKNLRVWIVHMKGAKNTIYEGESFKLRIAFPPQYPQVPPSVYFLPPHIPLHEHVYTNGDICLSLLGKDWRPTMTAQSIAVSILSILSSAQSKSLPMDNARHAQNRPGRYQKDWVYHDDNC